MTTCSGEIKVISLDHIDMAARELLALFSRPCIMAFYGKMGAGKTTIIKAICRQLKVVDTVTSPTFSIINEYRTQDGKAIYHFDFYRVEKEEELLDLGLEEYFECNTYCFIEWPEKAEHILTEDVVRVFIDVDEKGNRVIRL